jgi:hypothetical protein
MEETPESLKDQLIGDIIDTVGFKEGKPSLIVGRKKNGTQSDDALLYNEYLWHLYSMKGVRVASKLNNLRYSLRKGDGIFGMELLPVFSNLKRANKRSFSDFEKEFDLMAENIKNLPLTRFTAAFALSFKTKQELSFKIDIHRFRIISYDQFQQEFFNFDKEIQQAAELSKYSIQELKKLSEGLSFLIIEVVSRNHMFAQNCALKILQFALGMLIFSIAVTKGDTYTLSGSTEKSKLVLSAFFIFEGAKKLGAGSFSSERPFVENIEEDDLRNLEVSLDYFNEIRDKELKDVIFNALIAYYWASVDRELDDSAFKYWTCIEQLLLKSVRTTGTEIVERIKHMPVWGQNRYLEYQIENLYEKRNRYAHEYNADIHQIERNLAKAIADALLHFLLAENQSFLKKRELLRFYELIQKDSDELKHKLHRDAQALDDTERMTKLILELRES